MRGLGLDLGLDTVGLVNITAALAWVDSIRYLGVFIVRSRKFKSSFDNAKRSFFRSVNALFGKLGRSASEDVFLGRQ